MISGDFNFQIGTWRVKHRRLRERLVGSTDWEEFYGTSEMRPILGGNGNVEDNVLHISSGTYRAIALRSFDPIKESWAIWWLDSREPHSLDVPGRWSVREWRGQFLRRYDTPRRANPRAVSMADCKQCIATLGASNVI